MALPNRIPRQEQWMAVLLNWEKELLRFAPELKVSVLNHCDDRKFAIENACAGHIVLTTYGILSQEDEALLGKKWNVVCLDEAHTIKNRETKMSASAMKLRASSRVILTGTPIQMVQPFILRRTKVSVCMELVENILSGGNRVLIFSQFTSFPSMITAQLDQSGTEYHYLDGSTPIKKTRQNGTRLPVREYVIHLDPWWNPAIEQQATDRAHRIGQKQNVTVYHLISQHTIEEKILRLHARKRDLADTFLEGANLGHAMTIEDLKELVNNH